MKELFWYKGHYNENNTKAIQRNYFDTKAVQRNYLIQRSYKGIIWYKGRTKKLFTKAVQFDINYLKNRLFLSQLMCAMLKQNNSFVWPLYQNNSHMAFLSNNCFVWSSYKNNFHMAFVSNNCFIWPSYQIIAFVSKKYLRIAFISK